MANKSLKKAAILFSILLLPSLLYLLLNTGSNNFTPLPILGPRQPITVIENGEEVTDTLYHTIPEFSFTNQFGKTINSKDVEGKIYVADFFFTSCPTICPQMATHMLQIQNRFADRDDFLLLSHTIDPKNDDVERLKEYGEKVHAEKGFWHLLTGEKDSIYKIAMEGYFVSAMKDDSAPGGYLHSGQFVLVDKKGRIRGLFDGTSTSDVNNLYDAVEILYREEFAPQK